MIEGQTHPLDEVTEFGVTAHGLLRQAVTGMVREVDGVSWPIEGELPELDAWPIQLIRKPGIAPVPLTPEQLEAEREAGRVWQNYALLQSDWHLFGKRVGGWIYWASDGERWLVRPSITITTDVTVGQPFALTLECTPFGHFEGGAPVPVNLSVSVTDPGQTGLPAQRGVAVTSVSSTGALALLRLSAGGALPTGYLQIEVTDTGGVLAAEMSVLRTQAAAMGNWEQDYPATPWAGLRSYVAVGTPSPPTTEAKFPIGGGSFTFTVTGVQEVDFVIDSPAEQSAVGTASYSAEREGRLVALMFDDDDVLIEYTADTRYSLECDYPALSGAVSGSISASSTFDADFSDVMWAGTLLTSMSRTVTETLRIEVDIKQGGVVVEQAHAELAESSVQSLSYGLERQNPGGPVLMSDGQWRLLNASLAPVGAHDVVPLNGSTIAPITGNYSTSAPYAEAMPSRSGTEQLQPFQLINNASKMPTAPGDQSNLNTSIAFSNLNAGGGGNHQTNHYIDTAQGGVRLLRFHSTTSPNVVTRNELAIYYPHASAVGRGPVGINARQAYHPLTHELVIDSDGGTPVTFI
jgi:hypothetical protein